MAGLRARIVRWLRWRARDLSRGPGPRLMSELRKRWVIFRHPNATIRFQGPVYLGPGFSLHVHDHGSFIVGPGVEFRRNFRAEIHGDGRVVIGAGAHLTHGVLIQCSVSVEIGENSGLGHCCSIFDGKHRHRDLTTPFLEQGYDFTPIRIGSEVQVLSLCTIVNDVGDRCVIGANSVVTKPIPSYTVAVGAPARVVDYFGPAGSEPPELAASGDRDGGAER
jgi:acetyltransferase-like isoleucine patch superfamily enzyme